MDFFYEGLFEKSNSKKYVFSSYGNTKIFKNNYMKIKVYYTFKKSVH